MKEALWVFLGSGIGGALRYAVGLTTALWGPAFGVFPVATLAVNLAGSFLFGVLFALPYTSATFYLGLVGFCGGFTTFSALSGEGMAMLRAGHWGLFAFYVALSVVLGVAAAWGGFALVSK